MIFTVPKIKFCGVIKKISFQAVSTSYPHRGKGHIFTSKTPEKHLHNKRVSLAEYFSVDQARFQQSTYED